MTTKTDIYDVGKYTDIELYNILDLTNPTDRELEAKIHFFLNKYEQNHSQDGRKLYKFFNDIYTHLFDLSDQELDQELDLDINLDPEPDLPDLDPDQYLDTGTAVFRIFFIDFS